MNKSVAYLGPQGTFCESAAKKYIRKNPAVLIPCSSIEAVFAAVHEGTAAAGIVPLENSCEGSVNLTLDLLAYEYDLKIAGDIILPINHNLLIRSGVGCEDVSLILSHPQALAQCRKYLSLKFPGITLNEVTSTAEAARQVANSDEPWAAVGTIEAAQVYGLAIGHVNINDHPNNQTRFVVLSREDNAYIGRCKTSLVVYIIDQPGALFNVLKEFYVRGINLTKIESRPTRTKIGNYLFFIDIEGHRLEAPIQEALDRLSSLCPALRILGSYPSAMQRISTTRPTDGLF